MDLSGIISVSGMGGLFKVISQTRNGLMIESLTDGKRLPVFSSHKISALEDISIYGEQEDMPLKDIFSMIKKANPESLPDSKAPKNEIEKAFAELVPMYDEDRVYASDMKKVFTWYSLLMEKGLLEDSASEKESHGEDKPAAKETQPKVKAKPKPDTKKTTAKATSKGKAKPTTVRKTGV